MDSWDGAGIQSEVGAGGGWRQFGHRVHNLVTSMQATDMHNSYIAKISHVWYHRMQKETQTHGKRSKSLVSIINVKNLEIRLCPRGLN